MTSSPNDGPRRPKADRGIYPPFDPDVADSRVGYRYVGPIGLTAVTILTLAAIILIIYALIAIWPPPGAGSGPSSSHVLGVRLILNRDQQLFLVVALAGALGGILHSGRSFYWFAGNRALRRSWLVMYLFLPLIGSALAVIFCVILRGGLIVGDSTSTQVNYFGFAAVSALVGLFSTEAFEKLKQIFDTVLKPAETARQTDSAPTGPDRPTRPGSS